MPYLVVICDKEGLGKIGVGFSFALILYNPKQTKPLQLDQLKHVACWLDDQVAVAIGMADRMAQLKHTRSRPSHFAVGILARVSQR